MDFDTLIKSRRSVRKFKTKAPDWRYIIEAIDAARYAPMAGNNYTLKFILVDDPQKIKHLAEAAQQPFVAQAKYIVVVCSTTSRTTNLYGERGKMYTRQQAGAAIQNFLLKIEELGLATCWIGYFVEYIVKDTLSIPENVDVEAFFPVGYECPPKTKPKKKADMDAILYFNTYKEKRMKPIRKLNC